MGYNHDEYLANHCIVQMPIKKLKSMPMVTLKNMDSIMGMLDRFLRKHQIQRYNGYNQVQTGTRLINVGGHAFTEKIFSDEYYPSYSVHIGRCEHHVLFDKPEMYGSWNTKKHGEFGSVALSISTKYESSCIPICFGDRVKIFGDRLVIYHAFNKFTNHTPWMRYTELRAIPYTEKEKLSYKLHGSLITNLYDFIYEDIDEYGMYSELYKIINRQIREFCEVAIHGIEDMLDNDVYTSQHIIKTSVHDPEYGTLTVALDVDKALDENDKESECVTYEFVSEISDDKFVGHNLNHIKSDMINMVYKVNEYDSKYDNSEDDVDESDCDFDFEDFADDYDYDE